MDDRPPPPWIAFSGSLREFLRDPANRNALADWVHFLVTLSRAGLSEYEREYPAALGWEGWHQTALRAKDDPAGIIRNVMKRREQRAAASLIKTMWQATTLK